MGLAVLVRVRVCIQPLTFASSFVRLAEKGLFARNAEICTRQHTYEGSINIVYYTGLVHSFRYVSL